MKGLIVTPKKLIYFMIYYYFVATFLIGFCGVTTTIYYLTDVVNVVLVLFLLRKVRNILQDKALRLVNLMLGLLVIILALSIYVNEVPVLMIILGIRNMFRFFVVFFATISFLEKSDVERLMNFFLKIQIINFFIGIHKYFVLGLWSDAFGGGFFLNGSGLNPFCLMLICYYTASFLYKKENWLKFLFVLFSSIILAIFAEEKMLILVCCICVVTIYLIISVSDFKIEKRRVSVLMVTGAAIPVIISVIQVVAPHMIEIFSSVDSILEVGTASFEEGYRIPRVGAFEVIDDLFLKTRISRLLGLGLGNCDASGFAQSSFYQMYGDYHYRWFAHQWTYLECGKIGFACYVGFFISIGCSLLMYIKKTDIDNKRIVVASSVYAVSMIIFMWHSAAIKTDSGVFMFFMLALGFLFLRREYEEGGK